MNYKHSGTLYILFFALLFMIDRVTKALALQYLFLEPCRINNFLSFELLFNRGVSWGFLYSTNDYLFFAVSAAIVALIIGLLCYTIVRWMNHYAIVGEVMILAGGLSNVLDRILYKGVVDFCVVSVHGFVWPVFNFADVCIVVGALIAFVVGLQEA